jgi:23S rRNA (cytosine1962-C5)-methyltransferase
VAAPPAFDIPAKSAFMNGVLPCLVYEDDHLLVVNKPASLNTHAPSPYAGEGLYDWLRHREPRWASLAIIHRLDKETSGLIVFAKTRPGCQSLTQQFAGRAVSKRYLLVTDRQTPTRPVTVRSALVRAGEKYLSRPIHAGAQIAETRFRRPADAEADLALPNPARHHLLIAEPLTGRTHQIRVHAADQGFAVLGDTLYGGTPAGRVFLHAAWLTLKHPVSGEDMTFHALPNFEAEPRTPLRAALLDTEATTAWRLIHSAADGWPGWYVDRLGDYLLSQNERPLSLEQHTELARLARAFSTRGAYHKILTRHVRRKEVGQASPALELGEPAPASFAVRENGLQFEVSFHEGYSVGLFLDQRDNRRRLSTGHIAAEFPISLAPSPLPLELLNTFAYSCGFSVCAAKWGAKTTSLDLSKKYLDWGRRNFLLNQLDPAQHDFIYGDVFEWLRRLAKKGRRFDVVLLDPPTFSESKQSGAFRAREDYGDLVKAALPLVAPSGVLFASCNAADWPAADFVAAVKAPLLAAKRAILQEHYCPQPPDFPISRLEPAYLKTLWLRIG